MLCWQVTPVGYGGLSRIANGTDSVGWRPICFLFGDAIRLPLRMMAVTKHHSVRENAWF
jgi:hypothetical protein